MNNFSLKFVLVNFLIIIISISAPAQTFLFQDVPKEKTQIGLRFMRPSFDRDWDLSTFSGIYDFTFNIPVKSNLSVAASVPYVTSTFGNRDADNGIGNIFVGLRHIRHLNDQKSAVSSFGLFIPTAVEDIGFLGYYTHIREIYKYAEDVLTVYGNFAFFNHFPSGTVVGLEIGPSLAIPTDNNGDAELFLHYGLSAGIQANHFALLTELVGIGIITEDEDNFSDRFEHSINFGGSYVNARVSPGIFYKIYLKEDLRNVVDGVLGINLEAAL